MQFSETCTNTDYLDQYVSRWKKIEPCDSVDIDIAAYVNAQNIVNERVKEVVGFIPSEQQELGIYYTQRIRFLDLVRKKLCEIE